MRFKKLITAVTAAVTFLSALGTGTPVVQAADGAYILKSRMGFCTQYAMDYELGTNLAGNLLKDSVKWEYTKCFKRNTNEKEGQYYSVNQTYKFTLKEPERIRLSFMGKNAVHLIMSDIDVGMYDENRKPLFTGERGTHLTSWPKDSDFDKYDTGEMTNTSMGWYTSWIDIKLEKGTYYIYLEGTSSNSLNEVASDWLTKGALDKKSLPDRICVSVAPDKDEDGETVKPKEKTKTVADLKKSTPKINKLTQKNRIVTTKLKSKAVLKNSKYEVQYRVKGTKKWTSVKYKNTESLKTKKLTKKKTYQIRVREFTKKNGKTYYSKWSAVKTIKLK